LKRRSASHHPYELPEVIALPIVHGLPAYLAWVAAETRPSD
jgi:periplasmic divalent cation tolerance protein